MKAEDKTKEQLLKEIAEMRRQIIQLQKLETRQRRAEEELQNISEGSGDAMRLIDRDFNVLRCNTEMAKLIGEPAEGMIGTKCYDQLGVGFCHTEDCTLRRVLRGEKRIRTETVKETRNGRKIPLELVATPLTREGQVTGVIESFRDITERKRVEEALRESEEKYRVLFETAKGAIFLSDETGMFVDVNQAACESLGYSKDELLKLSNREIDADPRGYEAFLKVRNGPLKGMTFEVNQRRKDGSLLSVEITGHFFTIGSQRTSLAIVRDITDRKQMEKKLKDTLKDLRKALRGTIQAMALTVETRDPYTAGHQRRVADLARAIAKEMGFSRNKIAGIRMAGALHDIGKIAIPAEILSKPGPLSKAEFELIKNHPQVGYDILKPIKFPWPVAQIVLQHHERMDGSGYPQGLSGEDILPEARILGLADVVEAMASHRPYRSALGIDKALEEISNNRGKLYDVEVVDACLKLFKENGFKFKI